ncbi:unnamed protein product [Echinostoma caproni]|uniref:SLC12 domain-containing protein n=1 Tax=Echinostoma caproni TaxID=27848 RepID=A0A182ZZL6_9TREM|nr:unnamed protein product [Echinostoma caproni]
MLFTSLHPGGSVIAIDSWWDLIELTELRRLAHDHPILFVIVPPREVYEARKLARKTQSIPKIRAPSSATRETKPAPIMTRAWYRRSSAILRKDNSCLKQSRPSVELDNKSGSYNNSAKSTDRARGESSGANANGDSLNPTLLRKLLELPQLQGTVTTGDTENTYDRTGERESNLMSSTTDPINLLDQSEFHSKLLSILVHLGFLSQGTTQTTGLDHIQKSLQMDTSKAKSTGGPGLPRTVSGSIEPLDKIEGALVKYDNG